MSTSEMCDVNMHLHHTCKYTSKNTGVFFQNKRKKYFVYVNVCGPAENSKAGVNLRKLMEKWEQVF